jgi:hypothetical protein
VAAPRRSGSIPLFGLMADGGNDLGWGGRIRTCECRYQKPEADIPGQPKAAEICGFDELKFL